MKHRISIRIAVIIIFVVCTNMAEAQWYPPSASQNRSSGTSSFGTDGRISGTTYYSNANGSSAGSATRTSW